jgi:uncharacterized membrane protein HdeD (DUF308 family)
MCQAPDNPQTIHFIAHGALVVLGLVILLYGTYAQREVPVMVGAALMSIGYFHILLAMRFRPCR